MNPNAKSTLIAGAVSIITALIAAGATVWATERGKTTDREQEEKAATAELTSRANAAADQTERASEAGAAGAHDPVYVRSMTATVTAEGSPKSNTEGPVKADLCVLTSVGSYGGATKGCTLKLGNDGWTLVASARKATSTCQATCFDLRPGPNGPPST